MANNLSIKDGAGASKTLRTNDVGADVHAPLQIPADASGVPYAAANRLPVDAGQGAAGDSPPALATNASGTIGWLRATIDRIGEVQTNPTANTLLDRLKSLATALAGTLSVVAGGRTVVIGGTFTRPADTNAYAVGDLVANTTTASAVAAIPVAAARVNGGTGRITRARLKKSGAPLTNAQFRVHIYRDDPAASSGITNGDNGAWLTKEANYLGAFDITLDRAFSDGAKGLGVPTTGPFIAFDTAAGSQLLYALIEARANYTPANAEIFTLALEIDQD